MDHMDYRADIIYRFLELAVPYQPLAGDARPQQPYQQQIKRPQLSYPEKPVDGKKSGDEVRRQPGQRQLKRPRSPSPEGPFKRRNIGDEGKGYHPKRQPYGGKGGPPRERLPNTRARRVDNRVVLCPSASTSSWRLCAWKRSDTFFSPD